MIKRIASPVSADVYSECHHILPRSLGGDNGKENLVKLTAREHYIAHLLLTKFIGGEDQLKMFFAFSAMNMKSKSTLNRYQNSKLYAFLKEEFSERVSEYRKKLWQNEEFRTKIIASQTASWYDGKRELQLQWMKKNSPFKNKEIHRKTIINREAAGNNIFIRNNPMKNEASKQKKLQKTTGSSHYLHKTRRYYFDDGAGWKEIICVTTLEDALKNLGFSYATFMKMLGSNYSPKRGPLANVRVKREIV